jgi:hypothetical protein
MPDRAGVCPAWPRTRPRRRLDCDGRNAGRNRSLQGCRRARRQVLPTSNRADSPRPRPASGRAEPAAPAPDGGESGSARSPGSANGRAEHTSAGAAFAPGYRVARPARRPDRPPRRCSERSRPRACQPRNGDRWVCRSPQDRSRQEGPDRCPTRPNAAFRHGPARQAVWRSTPRSGLCCPSRKGTRQGSAPFAKPSHAAGAGQWLIGAAALHGGCSWSTIF